jgi:hypothetical protein
VHKDVMELIAVDWELLRTEWDRLHPIIRWRAKTMTATVKAGKQIVLLGAAGVGKSGLVSRVVRDLAGVTAALHEAAHIATWIALSTRLADRLVAEAAKLRTPQQRSLGDILFLVMPRPEALLPARNLFTHVAWANDRKHWLPVKDLVAVLSRPDKRRLIVGGLVDRGTATLTVYRGDLSSITVALASFKPTGTGLAPDPDRFAVIDGGQAIRLGGTRPARTPSSTRATRTTAAV